MNKYISIIVLLLSFAVSTASFSEQQHEITIYNDTATDVFYTILGTWGGAPYPITSGGHDTYHSGQGDQYMKVEIGACNKVSTKGYFPTCVDTGPSTVCSNGHYNNDLVKTITITSLNTCSIVCMDGGTTSCKQSG